MTPLSIQSSPDAKKWIDTLTLPPEPSDREVFIDAIAQNLLKGRESTTVFVDQIEHKLTKTSKDTIPKVMASILGKALHATEGLEISEAKSLIKKICSLKNVLPDDKFTTLIDTFCNTIKIDNLRELSDFQGIIESLSELKKKGGVISKKASSLIKALKKAKDINAIREAFTTFRAPSTEPPPVRKFLLDTLGNRTREQKIYNVSKRIFLYGLLLSAGAGTLYSQREPIAQGSSALARKVMDLTWSIPKEFAGIPKEQEELGASLTKFEQVIELAHFSGVTGAELEVLGKEKSSLQDQLRLLVESTDALPLLRELIFTPEGLEEIVQLNEHYDQQLASASRTLEILEKTHEDRIVYDYGLFYSFVNAPTDSSVATYSKQLLTQINELAGKIRENPSKSKSLSRTILEDIKILEQLALEAKAETKKGEDLAKYLEEESKGLGKKAPDMKEFSLKITEQKRIFSEIEKNLEAAQETRLSLSTESLLQEVTIPLKLFYTNKIPLSPQQIEKSTQEFIAISETLPKKEKAQLLLTELKDLHDSLKKCSSKKDCEELRGAIATLTDTIKNIAKRAELLEEVAKEVKKTYKSLSQKLPASLEQFHEKAKAWHDAAEIATTLEEPLQDPKSWQPLSETLKQTSEQVTPLLDRLDKFEYESTLKEATNIAKELKAAIASGDSQEIDTAWKKARDFKEKIEKGLITGLTSCFKGQEKTLFVLRTINATSTRTASDDTKIRELQGTAERFRIHREERMNLIEIMSSTKKTYEDYMSMSGQVAHMFRVTNAANKATGVWQWLFG